MRRFFLLLLVVSAISFIILVGWLNSDDFQHRAQSFLIEQVETASGENMEVERIRVHFWPPSVILDGVLLTNAQTEEPIVSVDRVRAPLVLRGGGPKLGRLTVINPSLVLHLEKDGKLREFRNTAKPKPGAKPLTELPWYSLHLIDGSIVVHVPDGVVGLSRLSISPISGPVSSISGIILVQYGELDEATALHVPNATLGPSQIVIPEFALETSLLALNGNFEHTLAGPLSLNLSAQADLDKFNILIPEPRAAHGMVDLDVYLEGKAPDLTLEASVAGRQLGAELLGVLVPVLSYDIGDVTASVRGHGDELEIERAVLNWGDDGSLTVWGTISKDLQLRDAHAIGEGVSLERLLTNFDAAPTPWIDMISDLEVELNGHLKPLHLSGDFDLAVAELNVGDRPISAPHVEHMLAIPHAYARGTMLIEKHHLYLEAPEVQGPRSRGELTVDIGFAPRGPLDLRMNLYQAWLPDFQPLSDAELQGYGQVSGRIWGPFNKLQFLGHGDVIDFGAVGFPWADHLVTTLKSPDMKSIHFVDAQATKGQSHYQGDFALNFKPPFSMDAELALTNGRVEDMLGIVLDLPGLTGSMNGYLSLHGPFYNMDGGTNFRFNDIDMWGEHFEIGQANGYFDQGLFTLDDMSFTRNAGREGLVLRGSVQRQWALNMELVGDGFGLERMD
ncbi:MAG: hypothetical protein HN348_27015, partial [Proteobacteria bacterium]|nr:hypothetical protein [Pseudomonadota bacterium]